MMVYFLFGKISNLLWQICCITGLIFIVAYGQILKHDLTIWSHCLVLSKPAKRSVITRYFFQFRVFGGCLSVTELLLERERERVLVCCLPSKVKWPEKRKRWISVGRKRQLKHAATNLPPLSLEAAHSLSLSLSLGATHPLRNTYWLEAATCFFKILSEKYLLSLLLPLSLLLLQLLLSTFLLSLLLQLKLLVRSKIKFCDRHFLVSRYIYGNFSMHNRNFNLLNMHVIVTRLSKWQP